MKIHIHQLVMLSAMAAALDIMPSGARAQAGYIDPSFLNGQSGPNSWVWALAEQADGRWLVGGQFTGFNDLPGGEVVRLNDDGNVDTNFTFNITAGETTVHSLAVQPDGRILVGGMFTGINGAACVRIGRLNADGSLDTNFVASATGSEGFVTVSHIGVQTNLQIVIAGSFDTVDGVAHSNIARLNPDGSLDSGYNASIDTPPNGLLVQSDDKVLIGGAFSTVNGQSSPHLARLNADGTLDTNFVATADGNVDTFAQQPDGKIIIGGAFTHVDTVSRNRIARLNTNGTLDMTFQNGLAGADDYVGCVAYDPAGRVLIGGQFSHMNNAARNWIARLKADGSLDTNFLATIDSFIELVQVQPDSRVMIEGSYVTTVDGRSRNRLARLQASLAPVISRPRTAGGLFSFDVNAVAGQTYGIVAATNLTGPWIQIASTNAAVDNLTFTTNTAPFPSRFFRVFR